MISTATKERKSIREYAPRRIRAKRFQQIPQWITESRTISRAAKHTWITLAKYANNDGQCWPSAQTLATAQDITRQTVHRHLRELEQAGAICRMRRWRKNGGGQTSNLYLLAGDLPLNLPDLPSAEETCPEINLNDPPPPTHFDESMSNISDPVTTSTSTITISPFPPNTENRHSGDSPDPPKIKNRKKRSGSRASGTNPRALGTNPRALRGIIKPMRVKQVPVEEQIATAYRRGWNYAGLTSPPPYPTADAYREYLTDCRYNLSPELIAAEYNGYADRIEQDHQQNRRIDERYGAD